MHANYRSELDGIRAIAVLAVVLFHAGLDFVPGGYAGVDVFFVISGYLITWLISREIEAGNFRFLRFWERRVRRIVPPLVVVVIFSGVGVWLLFFPDDLRDFSQSLMAVPVFLTNVVFWMESGYFDGQSELKPLQHTWSLAIEEQFYLIYPVCLVLAYRFRKGAEKQLLIAIFLLISFAISVFLVGLQRETAFYLLPSRAWELLVGAMLVFLPGWRQLERRTVREGIAWLGLAMLLATFLFYDEYTRFPGFSAILPCLGAGLLIWVHGGARTTSVSFMLSSRPAVFIGLISYSLYLWHWPLLVFGRYHAKGELEPVTVILLIIASFILATLSWKYVENPVRSRRVLKGAKSLTSVTVLLASSFLGLGLLGHFSNGYPERLDDETMAMYSGHEYVNPRRVECLFNEIRTFSVDEVCRVGAVDTAPLTDEVDFLVVGDSHANSIMPVIDDIARREQVVGLFSVYNGCPPLRHIYRTDTGTLHRCSDFNEAVLDLIRERQISNVMLVGRWSFYWDKSMIRATLENGKRPREWQWQPQLSQADAAELVETALTEFVREIDSEVNVWILKQVPKQAEYISPRYLAARVWHGDDITDVEVPYDEHVARQQVSNDIIQRVVDDSKGRIRTIDLTQYLCDEQSCKLVRQGGSLYRDDDHISTYAGQFVADGFYDFFEEVKQGAVKQKDQAFK